jgi:hypothetical protein
MNGARVRVKLVKADLQHKPPRIEIDDDARELLWPSFFAVQKYSDREPIQLELPNGEITQIPLDFLGRTEHEGHWGTTGTPALWAWLRATHANPGDDLIVEAIDGEKRRYRISHQPASKRDDAAIAQRTAETIEAGRQLLQSARSTSASSIWDMVRLLLVFGHYNHPIPPAPISNMWNVMLRRAENQQPVTSDIYQLKISLENSRPPIWRRVLVPGDWSLGALHYVVQVAMGWTNSHMHHFMLGNDAARIYYSLHWEGAAEWGMRTEDSSKIKLSQIAPKTKMHFRYEYDFGDSWMHRIDVEKILSPDPNQIYPHCIEGKRACPPEDCGGVWGYDSLLETIRDPEHDDHDDMLAWLEGIGRHNFDPNTFNLTMTNRRLSWIKPKQLDPDRNIRLFV